MWRTTYKKDERCFAVDTEETQTDFHRRDVKGSEEIVTSDAEIQTERKKVKKKNKSETWRKVTQKRNNTCIDVETERDIEVGKSKAQEIVTLDLQI